MSWERVGLATLVRIAAGFGGLVGAGAVDLLRTRIDTAAAFGAVFAAEAVVFCLAALMAARIMDSGRPAPALGGQAHV